MTRNARRFSWFSLGLLVALATPALAAVFNLFGPATGILKGSASTYQTTAAVSADVAGLWSGTCNSSTFLRGDGACATPSGTVSPGGADTQVQFNDSSAFGGDAGLTYNKTTDTLTIGTGLLVNSIDVSPSEGTDTQAGFSFASGCTAASGAYTLYWQKIGHFAHVYFQANCTSNATGWITGVVFPAAIRPTNTVNGLPGVAFDNSTSMNCGTANLTNAGSMVLGYCGGASAVWTASGTKQFTASWSYQLNN